MQMENAPLLKTKLYIPPRRPNLVFRPRLLARLEAALYKQHPLSLISAPAGSGKTTLIIEWLNRQERPSAWLSLDSNDNDPGRFFRYLILALQPLDIALSPAGLSALEMTEPPAELLITELINDIAAGATPFTLVIDDYHLIQNEAIHKALSFLIEHQPPEMHLILATRVDPPLPLAQLRARGQLTEIREQDLRFTPEEVAVFFNHVAGLELPAEAVATIERQTEGWAAGLQMAAISALGHQQEGDLSAFIQAFGGTNRFILDYLLAEVLNQQTPAVQDFLIETSILERMCGALCNALRFGSANTHNPSTADSQSILEMLERANLFVISLDDERHWYRYHHLFSDLLQSQLNQRRSAEQIRELHRRAGRWCLNEGDLGEAMTHMMAAQDFEQAAAIIDENVSRLIQMFSRSNSSLLLYWIEKLPEEIKRSQPWLDIYRADMLALNLQLDEVDPILEDVEKRIVPGSPRAQEILGHMASIRAYCANLRGEGARVIAMTALAEKYLQGGEYLAARGIAVYARADTYFAQDEIKSASQGYFNLLRIGEKSGQLMSIIVALSELAMVSKVQGQLSQAEERYSKMYQRLSEQNGLESRVRCSYEFGLADLLRERNQLNAAYAHVMAGIEHRRRFGGYALIGDLALMHVLQALGDTQGALKALREAEAAVQAMPFQMALMLEFKTTRMVQWLAVGDLEMASNCASECSGGSEQEQIALARLRLSQGRPADARHILAQQEPQAKAGGRTGRLIEILALQALALKMQEASADAISALTQALVLAQPEGYRRIFIDLGQPLYELLERAAAQASSASAAFARELMTAMQQAQQAPATIPPRPFPAAITEALTERELDVLRLLAEGLSNKEMASQLVVAPSTIKQHLKSIFGKLDAHSRTQAIARGRELKLL